MINFETVTRGNPEAKQFIEAWGRYSRAVDNFIDNGKWDPKAAVNCFALAILCYSTPFYAKNAYRLHMVALVTTLLWEVSVNWEAKEQDLWKRQFADVLRHSDVILMSAVTAICADWATAGEFAQTFLEFGYHDHRRRYGSPLDPPTANAS